MKDKPEKKEIPRVERWDTRDNYELKGITIGHNQAISAYEEYLPDEEEIIKMIKNKYWDTLEYNRDLIELHAKDLAKVIAKRIGKE